MFSIQWEVELYSSLFHSQERRDGLFGIRNSLIYRLWEKGWVPPGAFEDNNFLFSFKEKWWLFLSLCLWYLREQKCSPVSPVSGFWSCKTEFLPSYWAGRILRKCYSSVELFLCDGCLQTSCFLPSETWFLHHYWLFQSSFSDQYRKKPNSFMFTVNCHHLGINFSLITWYVHHISCLDHTIRMYCTYVEFTADLSSSLLLLVAWTVVGIWCFFLIKDNHSSSHLFCVFFYSGHKYVC